MAPSQRSGAAGRASMRQQPSMRSSTIRHQRQGSMAPPPPSTAAARGLDRAGAVSPAESVASTAMAGTKRKERDFEAHEGEATNINVVVRCRGRNAREVSENSAVVIRTDGVKGNTVELSLGPNALSNKTYSFDRVFSAAADQSMVYDDVVKPILDEMLAGYNCTIFAYGQTGTGKTYTMSGDMSDTFGVLSEAAGIIPRVLQSLFNKLEMDDTECNVRCSFIELYNEELRDLLSAEEGKLKIFDDASRKGPATTVVQGMEERHIANAAEGIKRLQEGSVRRQVAATKCNDLSSRSHTIFTISVYVKKSAEAGDDFFCAGKLNLVDLAGSENIQRSGAENKRAAEAGLINKSLLTLGRVINALVDRSAHIPYRESKLTRLLQDSLGGRTKTCIIATISPARSNLEETISTLNYAFCAKNIRNKPQTNALINKKTLLREFTAEIEKLRSELIATRQRNGVYLSNDAYEEMTVQAESRRILVEEQGAKIETLEANLRNKLQELYALTSGVMGLKKENESARAQLDEAKDVLDQTELVLAATRKALAEETHLRKAHQQTEDKLRSVGGELISTLQKTVTDVSGLHAKNKRKSDLQSLNRNAWETSQIQVAEVTEMVEHRVQEFRHGQQQHIQRISGRMQTFMREELDKLAATQGMLETSLDTFAQSEQALADKTKASREEMDDLLEEIKVVRDNIKRRVGDSLQAIASAAERIAGDVLSELSTFHDQMHSSYSSLGRDFRSLFEDLSKQIGAQQQETDSLRRQLEGAGDAILDSNVSLNTRIEEVLAEERRQSAEERQRLLAQITALVNSEAESRETRLADKAALLRGSVTTANQTFRVSLAEYSVGADALGAKVALLLEDTGRSRDAIKTRLQEDWTTANGHSASIQATTKSVYAETVRVVDEQMQDLDVQMTDLDEFVTRARSQNSRHQEQHGTALAALSDTAQKTFVTVSTHLEENSARAKAIGGEVDAAVKSLSESLSPMEEDVCQPLAGLREDVSNVALREYQPTGETPERVQYRYPTQLPQTEGHETLLAEAREAPTPSRASAHQAVFSDNDFSESSRSPVRPSSSAGAQDSQRVPLGMSLREVNANLTTGSLLFDPAASTTSAIMPLPAVDENTVPLFKRSVPARPTAAKHGRKHFGGGVITALEGRENVPPAAFSQSLPRRKSPRLH